MPTLPRPDSTPLEAQVAPLLELLKLATLISRPMRVDLADPQGLSINELRVLMCIAGEGPIAGHAIAEVMAIPPMNVSRALAALQQRDWVERVPNPGNARLRPMRLSAAGIAAYRAMLPDLAGIAGHLFQDLDAGQRTLLQTFLEAITRRTKGPD
jgi:DNA-binding MarR family transcriptional regulator